MYAGQRGERIILIERGPMLGPARVSGRREQRFPHRTEQRQRGRRRHDRVCEPGRSLVRRSVLERVDRRGRRERFSGGLECRAGREGREGRGAASRESTIARWRGGVKALWTRIGSYYSVQLNGREECLRSRQLEERLSAGGRPVRPFLLSGRGYCVDASGSSRAALSETVLCIALERFQRRGSCGGDGPRRVRIRR